MTGDHGKTARERLPLSRRLAFKQARVTLLIALLLGLGFGLVQVGADYSAEMGELESSVSRLIQSNRPAAAEAVWTLNAALADGVANGIVGFKPVLEASLTTSAGTVLTTVKRKDRPQTETNWSLQQTLTHLLFDEVRELIVPLAAPDPAFKEPIGILRVVVSPEAASEGFFRRAGFVVLGGIVRNMALALLLLGVFYAMVSRPLGLFTDKVAAINPRRLAPDTEDSLEMRTNDEFQILGHAMATVVAAGRGYMRETLNAKKALEDANAKLEDRVKERTRELETAVGALENLAVTDSLTGIYNRRFFVDVLAKAVSLRKRHPDEKLAVLMADIDLFKNVNDTHGHAAGDAVLVALADVLKGSARESDTVARLGGEEFAVLLPGTNAEQALLLADRIRASIQDRSVTFRNQVIQVTASIGVAEASDSLDTADGLLHAADMALYDAKEGGRNRVAVFQA